MFSFAILASGASAASNAFTYPTSDVTVTAGDSFNIKWTNTSGSTAQLILRTGASSDLETVQEIASDIDNDGEYTWTVPTNITTGSYAIEIKADDDENYTPYFTISSSNSTDSANSTTSSTASSETSTAFTSSKSASKTTSSATTGNATTTAASTFADVTWAVPALDSLEAELPSTAAGSWSTLAASSINFSSIAAPSFSVPSFSVISVSTPSFSKPSFAEPTYSEASAIASHNASLAPSNATTSSFAKATTSPTEEWSSTKTYNNGLWTPESATTTTHYNDGLWTPEASTTTTPEHNDGQYAAEATTSQHYDDGLYHPSLYKRTANTTNSTSSNTTMVSVSNGAVSQHYAQSALGAALVGVLLLL